MDVEKEIREYLPHIIHLSLGTTSNNKPWVCEVHFAYDEDLNLYYRSLSTRRHSQEIAANPNVAGNIVKQHTADEAVIGVYFEGTARIVQSAEEKQKAFQAIKARLDAGDDILEESNRPDGHQFYKISVEKFYLFGSFNGTASQKYELVWNGGKK